MKINERDYTVDCVRTICMILIMFAHTMPNDLFFELRAFDVVGLVYVSGLCTKRIDLIEEHKKYLKKRIKKLLKPTYIAITVIMMVTFVISCFTKNEWEYNIKSVFLAYTLTGGIAYFWIVRIFLMIACALPYIQKLVDRKTSKLCLILIILFSLVTIELLSYWSELQSKALSFFLDVILIPLISYSLVTFVSLEIKYNNRNSLFMLVFWSIIFYLSLLYCQQINTSISITTYKYPPRTVYLSYGMMITLLLSKVLFKTHISENNILNKIILFVSSNSFKIYFTHIFIMLILDELKKNGLVLENSYFLSIAVSILSILLCYLKLRIFEKNRNSL